MIETRLLSIVAVSIFAAGIALPVSAFAETTPAHNATQTFTDVNPCTQEPATITLTYNGVTHSSSDATGGSHNTETQTGTFVIAQDNGVMYTGHFTFWDGFNGNNGGTNEFTMTLSLRGTGSDGSALIANTNSHQTTNPAGVTTSMFDNLNCR